MNGNAYRGWQTVMGALAVGVVAFGLSLQGAPAGGQAALRLERDGSRATVDYTLDEAVLQGPNAAGGAEVPAALKGPQGPGGVTSTADASRLAVVAPGPEPGGPACTTDADCYAAGPRWEGAICVANTCYVPKNRYLSIDPRTNVDPVAYQVTVIEALQKYCSVSEWTSCEVDANCPAGQTCEYKYDPGFIGTTWWLEPPVCKDFAGKACPANSPGPHPAPCTVPDSVPISDCSVINADGSETMFGWHSSLGLKNGPAPPPRTWTEYPLHIGDCAIAPVVTYEIAASDDDGASFGPPLEIMTIRDPDKDWGDITGGAIQGPWPMDYSPPEGFMNFTDLAAFVDTAEQDPSGFPPVSWVDMDGDQGVTGKDAALVQQAFLQDPGNGLYPCSDPSDWASCPTVCHPTVVAPAPDLGGRWCITDANCDAAGDRWQGAICVAGTCYIPKNRYLSIDPTTNTDPVAYQVTFAEAEQKICNITHYTKCLVDADCPGGETCIYKYDRNAIGTTWWLEDPICKDFKGRECPGGPWTSPGSANPDDCLAEYVGIQVNNCSGPDPAINNQDMMFGWHCALGPKNGAPPPGRVWTESPVHVGDSIIVPVVTYTIAASDDDGASFGPVLEIMTIRDPDGDWGDTVGTGAIAGPSPQDWYPPNRFNGTVDFTATIASYEQWDTGFPPYTWTDLDQNQIANTADMGAAIRAFEQGLAQTYIDDSICTTDGDCPRCYGAPECPVP